MPKTSLIAIGNELLRGRIVNTNATEAALLLRRHGLSLSRVLSISDEKAAILSAIEEEFKHSEVLIMCGGLGPTKDDVTKQSLLEWSNSEWVWDKNTEQHLEKRYADRKHALTELTRLQARVPSACEVLHNSMGTAPGMLFRQEGGMLFSLPGVPFEMLSLLEDEVIPRIKDKFPAGVFSSVVFRLADIPESKVAQRLESLELEIPPNLQFSYLPRNDGLWLELSARLDAGQELEAEKLLGDYGAKVAEIMADKVYAKDDVPIGGVLGSLMKERKLSLAVAESLTGGNVSSRIVEVSGASKYFKGAVVAYAEEVKIDLLEVPKAQIDKCGVVSAEVAKAMASGVRKLLKADIGIATTGYAESSPEIKAHAFLGYADHLQTQAREVRLLYDRKVNIERCSNYLIQWCLKNIRETLD